MKILNLAAGKFDPLVIPGDNLSMFPQYIVNVDTSYYDEGDQPGLIEYDMRNWEDDPDRISKTVYLNLDVFEFMERCKVKFDRVVIYRFLEHVSFTQVEYFIYLVSTVLNKDGLVDVIVPNYRILAQSILDEDRWEQEYKEFNFQNHNITLTTELLNEPSCPHASIWTPKRMIRFWELEGRFTVEKNYPSFEFDGRDLYLRSIIKRV